MTTHTNACDGALAAVVDDQLPGAELPDVPRRFAIFTYDADDEPELYLWGLQTAEHAIGCHRSGASTHRADTTERIRHTIDRAMDATLVWLDSDPAPHDASQPVTTPS